MPDTPPVIAIIGPSASFYSLIPRLQQRGYTIVHVHEPEHLVESLLEQYPALILISAAEPGWVLRVASIKAEQALRRLRVLVVTPDTTDKASARAAGADGCIRPDAALEKHIDPMIRRLPAEIAAQLACQCREPLPPLGRLGVERFNAGRYYDQHDAFEAQWMAESGPVRDLYRAVLQVGVAYYHLERGNVTGGLRMLRRCVQWFALLPDECQGIDLHQLREDAARVRAVVQQAAGDHTGEVLLDPALFKPIRLKDSP